MFRGPRDQVSFFFFSFLFVWGLWTEPGLKDRSPSSRLVPDENSDRGSSTTTTTRSLVRNSSFLDSLGGPRIGNPQSLGNLRNHSRYPGGVDSGRGCTRDLCHAPRHPGSREETDSVQRVAAVLTAKPGLVRVPPPTGYVTSG